MTQSMQPTSWLQRQRENASARQVTAQARVYGIKIKDGTVSRRGQSGPLAGARATIESVGDLHKRITATRLVTTGVFALALKKTRDDRQVFLTITGAEDSYTILVELKGDPKTQASARQFAAGFNSLAN